MPSRTSDPQRYITSYSHAWKMAVVEDTYSGEEVCWGDDDNDMEVVCECLNKIEYDRGQWHGAN